MTNDQFTEWLESQIKSIIADEPQSFTNGYRVGMVEALKQYRSLAPTWIPVTPETMPEEGQEVIIYCKREYAEKEEVLTGWYAGNWYSFYCREDELLTVYGWMVKPAPPIK